ncbi:MAG: hypothetical protein Q7N50_09965 [Armatimonadota bacterium]|nr:hypothetical protein [Armatimonadota bacterium]
MAMPIFDTPTLHVVTRGNLLQSFDALQCANFFNLLWRHFLAPAFGLRAVFAAI